MKSLIELSTGQYESLLSRAGETLPMHLRLKNSVKTQADTIVISCDLDETEMLLQAAKRFYPDAVPQMKRRSKPHERNGSVNCDLHVPCNPDLTTSTR
jgi:hypothetical protein